MKNFNYYMGMIAIFALLLTSCSKEETSAPMNDPSSNSATVLSFRSVLNDLSGRSHFDQVPTCSEADPAYAVLEISYEGQAPATMGPIEVEILSDEEGLFTAYSELLKVPVPNNGSVMVTLESFQVFDADDNLIWIAPIENVEGEFDGYVDNPLPFDFEVNDGTKPYIDVEVLCFDRRMVNEYGYPFFDIFPGKIYPLCFFANYCTDSGRHYVGNYGVDLYYFDGDNTIQLYSSDEAMPELNESNNSADPVCLVVPESPFDNPAEPYLYYVITPKDWPGYYGDVSDDTPLPEVWLSWNDVEGYLNDDGETNEYIHLFINCDDNPGGGDCVPTAEDTNGDCIPDNQQCVEFPELCPSDCPITDEDSNGDCIPDEEQCDLFPELCPDDCTPTEDDTNGDCIPDDQQCELFPELCDEGEGNCGTGYMEGDTPINSISNANKWGWAEHWTAGDGATQTFDFWVGAGQNDTSKASKAGTVTITVDGDQVHFEIDLINDYEIGELHVHLSEDQPSGNVAKAPGLYNRNYQVSSSDLDFTLTRTGLEGDDDNDFWVLVHGGDVCNHE